MTVQLTWDDDDPITGLPDEGQETKVYPATPATARAEVETEPVGSGTPVGSDFTVPLITTPDVDTVAPGGDITVTGSGLAANGSGQLQLLTGAPGTDGEEIVSVPVTADATGDIGSVVVSVPADAEPGDYHLVLTGGEVVIDNTAITVSGEPPVEGELTADKDTLDSSGDEAERTVTVSGSGFPAETAGRVSVNEGAVGSGGDEIVGEDVTTDADGAFADVALIVPVDQAEGDYHIAGVVGDVAAEDLPLTITSEPVGPAITTDKDTVDSSGDEVERTITVGGTGFEVETAGTVELLPGAPGSGGTAVVSEPVTTDAEGAFEDIALLVPEDQAEGDYHIVGTVGEAISDDTPITVTSEPAVPTLTPDKTELDSSGDETERTVTVTGEGLPEATAGRVSINEGAPESGGDEVVGEDVTTEADGTLAATALVVPLDQEAGDYHVLGVFGEVTVDEHALTITGGADEPALTADKATLDSTGDEAERTVAISGENFEAETAGTVAIHEGAPESGGDEIVSDDVTTDAEGAFEPVNLIVPPGQVAGDYHIIGTVGETVSDDTPLEITGGAGPVMDEPTNVAAGTVTDTTIPLTWDAVTTPVAADTYVVRYAPTETEDWTELDPVAVAEDTIDELTADTAYDIQVKAQAADHTDSAWSTVITATTAA